MVEPFVSARRAPFFGVEFNDSRHGRTAVTTPDRVHGGGAIVLVTIAWWVPLPTAIHMRLSGFDGAWFTWPFLPPTWLSRCFVPRTAFTLAAGLLFRICARCRDRRRSHTLAALLALLLVRAAGWQLSRLVSHPAVESVDATLRRRGWSATSSHCG